MIITCERCATQFQLDDAKIPTGGARVRCSRCECSFEVEPPARSDLARAEELAQEALLGEEAGVGDFADDAPLGEEAGVGDFADDAPLGEEAGVGDFADDAPLGEEAGVGDFADDAPLGEETSAGDLAEEGLSDEEVGAEVESDWEFNDDADLAESLDTEALADDPSADADLSRDELFDAQGAVDDLLGGVDPDAYPLDALADEVAPEIDKALPDLEIGGSEELGVDLSADEASPAVEPVAEPAAAEEVADDPSTWDVFDSPSESLDGAFPVAQDPLTSGAGQVASAHSEPRVSSSVAVASEISDGPWWKAQLGGIAGWAIVSMLLVAGLVGGLAGQSEVASAQAGRWQGGGFVADQIRGRWLDNAVVGPIYVVTGRLGLDTATRATARTRLQIQLVDDNGRALDLAPAWIGPELSPRVLRESAPVEIQALQERGAADLMASAVGGATFVAVVADMPDTAARFELQTVEVEYDPIHFQNNERGLN